MTDVILGMGEVGSTLYALFTSKKIRVEGKDIDDEKCRGEKIEHPNILHICIPFNNQFITNVDLYDKEYNPSYIIIHSTIKPRTCEKLAEICNAKIIYSPTRGVHSRFLDDIMRYTKFFAYDGDDDHNISDIFRDRFNQFSRAKNTITLELSKLLTDTTYYGLLIGYRKLVDNYVEGYDVDPDELWKFAEEIHTFLENRPIMYNDKKPIGGHCVIPNLDLIEGLDEIKKIIDSKL